MRKGQVSYFPFTTLIGASERRKGRVTYLPVKPATEKGPARFTWHLTGFQERRISGTRSHRRPPPLTLTCIDVIGINIIIIVAHSGFAQGVTLATCTHYRRNPGGTLA